MRLQDIGDGADDNRRGLVDIASLHLTLALGNLTHIYVLPFWHVE